MSLVKSVATNYVAQAYISTVSLIAVPLYARYMGAEAFGLIGFSSMVQAWFNLLDFGLVLTVARQVVCFQNGSLNRKSFLKFLKCGEILFGVVACIVGIAFVEGAGFVSEQWLSIKELGVGEVRASVSLIGCGLALRWMTMLYRAIMTGREQFSLLAVLDGCVATLRFGGVFVVFFLAGVSVVAYFSYQLVIAALECALFHFLSHRGLDRGEKMNDKAPKLNVVQLMRFSFSVWVAGFVWVVSTQTDKLILSQKLSLAEYGAYALAVQIAGGVFGLSLPITSVVLPRLTAMFSKGEEEKAIRLYRNATQVLVVASSTMAVVLSVFSHELIKLLVGRGVLVESVPPILTIYVIGSAISSLSSLAYVLQSARGNLDLHFVGSIVFMCALVPAVFSGASLDGGYGAALAWSTVNAAFFAFWIPFVHSRFARRMHFSWLVQDVVKIALPTGMVAIACFVASRSLWPNLPGVFWVVACSLFCGLTAVVFSDVIRGVLFGKFRSWVGG